MNTVLQHNIGAYAIGVPSIVYESSVAATIDGVSIDRAKHSMPLSCIMYTSLGAVTGAPSAVSVQSTLQDSADGTNFANYLYDGVNAAQGTAMAAGSAVQNWNVDLWNARRYLRVVTVIGFTGGTSPAVPVSAHLILGGEQTVAAV